MANSVRFLVLLVFSISFANAAIGGRDSKCESILRAPPIPRTIQPTYPIEMESAGELILAEENIPPLKTMFYTFLVTSRGEILLAEKYAVKSFLLTGQGLATHKSLLNMYAEKTLSTAANKIVGAGEFQVAFGNVVDISNRSGNFRTNSKRFHSIVGLLAQRGLLIEKWTSVRAIDPTRPEERGHTPADREFDQFHLETMAVVERAENGPRLREFFGQFHQLTCETFPYLSSKDAIAKIMEMRRAGTAISHQMGGLGLIYPLVSAYSRDGIDFGIMALLRTSEQNPHDTCDRFEIVSQIDNILLGAGNLFSAPLREKWKALENSFCNL